MKRREFFGALVLAVVARKVPDEAPRQPVSRGVTPFWSGGGNITLQFRTSGDMTTEQMDRLAENLSKVLQRELWRTVRR